MYLINTDCRWDEADNDETGLHAELCAMFAETCKVLILVAFSREATAVAEAREKLTGQLGRLSIRTRLLLQEVDGPSLPSKDEPTGVTIARELAAQTRRLLALLSFPPAAAELA